MSTRDDLFWRMVDVVLAAHEATDSVLTGDRGLVQWDALCSACERITDAEIRDLRERKS